MQTDKASVESDTTGSPPSALYIADTASSEVGRMWRNPRIFPMLDQSAQSAATVMPPSPSLLSPPPSSTVMRELDQAFWDAFAGSEKGLARCLIKDVQPPLSLIKAGACITARFPSRRGKEACQKEIRLDEYDIACATPCLADTVQPGLGGATSVFLVPKTNRSESSDNTTTTDIAPSGAGTAQCDARPSIVLQYRAHSSGGTPSLACALRYDTQPLTYINPTHAHHFEISPESHAVPPSQLIPYEGSHEGSGAPPRTENQDAITELFDDELSVDAGTRIIWRVENPVVRYRSATDFSLSGTTSLGARPFNLDSGEYNLVMASTSPSRPASSDKDEVRSAQRGPASSTMWFEAKSEAQVSGPLGRSVMAQLFKDANGHFLDFYTSNLKVGDGDDSEETGGDESGSVALYRTINT